MRFEDAKHRDYESVRRARRDGPLAAHLSDGDLLRRDERAQRAAVMAHYLASLDAPEPSKIAVGVLSAVGSFTLVPAHLGPKELGYAGEIALAGCSAGKGERDFGLWEVKTSFTGRDENTALRLFGWSASASDVDAIKQASDDHLGWPLARVVETGPGLRIKGRVLAAVDQDERVRWRRILTSLVDRHQTDQSATVMLHATLGPAYAGLRLLEIDGARLMWKPAANGLAQLLAAGGAGIGASDRKHLMLAVRRAQLHLLYDRAIDVGISRTPTSTRLVVRGHGRAGDALRHLIEAQPHAVMRKHSPMLCVDCGSPLAWPGTCTACPSDGFAA